MQRSAGLIVWTRTEGSLPLAAGLLFGSGCYNARRAVGEVRG
jgi:hypothetical protein